MYHLPAAGNPLTALGTEVFISAGMSALSVGMAWLWLRFWARHSKVHANLICEDYMRTVVGLCVPVYALLWLATLLIAFVVRKLGMLPSNASPALVGAVVDGTIAFRIVGAAFAGWLIIVGECIEKRQIKRWESIVPEQQRLIELEEYGEHVRRYTVDPRVPKMTPPWKRKGSGMPRPGNRS